jgi:hypothetical protein
VPGSDRFLWRIGVRAACVLLVAFACVAPAHADWKDDYARGVRAVSDGNWAEVESRMRAALAGEPAPAARARLYGQRFDAYVPRYYLGLAAYRQGRCADAVREWGDAATRAIWSANAELARVANAGLAECQTRLAQAAPAATPTPAATPVAAQSPPPPVTRPTPAPTPARTPVASASPAATPAPVRTPVATPAQGQVAAAASRAPAALVSVLDAYLGGRYDAAAAVDPASIGDARARAHALLVRAAARHTQSLLRGGDGAALLEQAATDVRAAKALDARLTPDTALFSPRFRAFWTATR